MKAVNAWQIHEERKTLKEPTFQGIFFFYGKVTGVSYLPTTI